ncbi:MAG: M23 family metallopeptidase [Spirochaetia bacterium]|nr:M23 family metallopeptidase [Spirochaetia bacterium]
MMSRITRKNSIKLGGITIMLIPHSQKHVYRMRINKWWIYFVGFFIFSVFVLSMTTLLWYKRIDVQKQSQEKKMNVWNNHKWVIDHNQVKIDEKIHDFISYGDSFYFQIWNKQYEKDEVFQKNEELNSARFAKVLEPLDSVIEFVILREENFKNLPLGWPIDQGTITSEFGDRISPFGFNTDFHSGTDFANAIGTPIHATSDGEVTFASGSNTGYGNYVKILHSHGFITLYGHASKILVHEKQMVKRGDVIALLGRSGSVTGPHVHYEVRQESLDDKNAGYELFLNPMPFIKEKW